MPTWDAADQTLAKALQKELGKKEDGLKDKVEALKPPSPETEPGGSDDVGDMFVGGFRWSICAIRQISPTPPAIAGPTRWQWRLRSRTRAPLREQKYRPSPRST